MARMTECPDHPNRLACLRRGCPKLHEIPRAEDPLAMLLIAVSDWHEAETTDHDSFGPRQDARVALIEAYESWMGPWGATDG